MQGIVAEMKPLTAEDIAHFFEIDLEAPCPWTWFLHVSAATDQEGMLREASKKEEFTRKAFRDAHD